MPRVVDHAARRDEVASVGMGLVARGGMDALTTRSVAEAAGYSTAVVSHYFSGKDDLLVATFRYASDRSRARFLKAVAGATVDDRLMTGLEQLLATTPEARAEWMVFLAFWGKAIAIPELAAEQALRVRSAADRIAALVNRQGGGTATERSRHDLARELLVAVQGISTYAIFDPEEWTAKRQRRMLREHVDRVLT